MKGGIYKVYNVAERRPVYADTGWIYKTGQVTYSNHMHQVSATIEMLQEYSRICGQFFQSTNATLSPFLLVILRLLNLSILRFQWTGELARRQITRVLFTRKLKGDIKLERYFHWEENIRVETTVSWPDGKERFFYITSNYTSIPMASAKYFQTSDVFSTLEKEPQCLFSGQTYTIAIRPHQSVTEGAAIRPEKPIVLQGGVL